MCEVKYIKVCWWAGPHILYSEESLPPWEVNCRTHKYCEDLPTFRQSPNAVCQNTFDSRQCGRCCLLHTVPNKLPAYSTQCGKCDHKHHWATMCEFHTPSWLPSWDGSSFHHYQEEHGSQQNKVHCLRYQERGRWCKWNQIHRNQQVRQ